MSAQDQASGDDRRQLGRGGLSGLGSRGSDGAKAGTRPGIPVERARPPAPKSLATPPIAKFDALLSGFVKAAPAAIKRPSLTESAGPAAERDRPATSPADGGRSRNYPAPPAGGTGTPAPLRKPPEPMLRATSSPMSRSHIEDHVARRLAARSGMRPLGGAAAEAMADMAHPIRDGAAEADQASPAEPPSEGDRFPDAPRPANDTGGLYPAHPGLAGLTVLPTRPAAGDPYAPIAGRSLNSLSPSNIEKRPITPRSPRAALEPEQVPVPTKRSKRARHPLVRAGNAILTLLVLLAILGGGAFVIGKQRFEAAGPLSQDRVVVIPKGYGIRDISELLMREGVIDQPYTFMAGVIALKARDGLKSGEYQFAKHASLHDVVNTILDGKVVQHLITIPEGHTSEQIVARLMEEPILSGNIKEIPPEGTLLPEGYRFTRGTPREQILQRMQRADQRLVQEVWERRMPDLPLKTPEELVILASIVEKETGRPDERTRVAAVFINRLKQHMRLQSDPTIIYGLVGGKGSLGHPITKSEKEQPTPYNTYLINGLPPGPIANPGRASLEAVANPARTRELYFVADGHGGHVFSDSYDQHQKAVAKLRLVEQQQHAPPAEQTAAPAEPPQQAAAPETPRARPSARRR